MNENTVWRSFVVKSKTLAVVADAANPLVIVMPTNRASCLGTRRLSLPIAGTQRI